jgi:cell division septation protein DedD
LALIKSILQLVATDQRQSTATIDALRNNGLTAIASRVPEKPGVYRVLVGPLHEGEVDQMRADLQRRGLPGDSAIKRTF